MTGGSQATLAHFARFIARNLGLRFPEERLSELEQKMAVLAREAGHGTEEYLLWLMSVPLSRERSDTLARALTIGETYFLRDPKSYQVLEQEVLPELIARRRATDKSLRIWSAGCSSGEEPYTLAILLSRLIPDLDTWKISLVATDLNPQALERGREGVYSRWSFRNAPAWLMEYFKRRADGRFEISPALRAMVRFEQMNLVEEGLPPGIEAPFDIIFCRNVLLYFDPEQIVRTIASFHAALVDTGWLFVGPTEVDQQLLQGFSCRNFGGAFALRKLGPEAAAEQSRRGTPRTLPGRPAPPLPDRLPSPLAPTPVPGAGTATRPKAAAHQAPASGPVTPAPGVGHAAAAEAPPAEGVAGPAGQLSEADAFRARTLELFHRGAYQEAAEGVRRAQEKAPQPAETLALGARAYANLGRLGEARELLEHALAADRLSAQNHYLHAIILEQQGELEAAAASLKNVLFLDQDHLLAYFALGNLYRQAGNERESERNFTNALRLLGRRDPREVLPEAEGMTAGGLVQMIQVIKGRSADGNG